MRASRPDLRDGADAGRPQAGGPLLAAHADARWPPHFGAAEAEVDTQVVCVDKKRQWSQVAQRLALLGDPLDALHARRPGRAEALFKRDAVCLTPSSSARARTGWPRRSCWRARAARCTVLEARGDGRRRLALGGADAPRLRPRRLLGRPPARARLAVPARAAAGRARARAGPARAAARAPARRRHRGGARALGRGDRGAIGGADGEAYRRLIEPLVRDADELLPAILGPLRPPRHPLALARFGLRALRSATGLARRASTGRARARCSPAARALDAAAATARRPRRSGSC